MLNLFKRMNKRQCVYIILCVLFITLQVYLDLKIPDYMTNITTIVQTKGSKINDVLTEGSKMLLCALFSLVAAVITGYFASYIAAYFGLRIRSDIFKKVQSFTMSEIKKFQTSSLLTRTTNDVTQVQTFLAIGLQVIIKAPIMSTWAIIKIASKNYRWSIATAIVILIILVMILTLIKIALPKFRKVQKLTDNINRVTRENLTGIRIVRAYNAEEYQNYKFKKANLELTNTNMFTQRMMSIIGPVMTLSSNGLTLSIYIIGSYLISQATLANKLSLFSDMVVFTSYAMQVILSFMLLALIFIIYPRSSVAAKRIKEVLETDILIKSGSIKKGKKNLAGTIEFKNVSFKYPDAESYMLRDISFKVNKGDVVAFIGSTGSGKSTLINLIPRFYDVTKGEVLVEGINVKDYDMTALTDKIGYISQKAIMFKGTVKENVAFGVESVNDSKINDALKASEAKYFVEKMDSGIDSFIAQGGSNISGGQKQRLSIARAIYKNPSIYIFDDSFSALDYKTDALVRKNLKEYTNGATTLIVAQRIGTIMNADLIIVLDEGKIVGIGKHKELLKNCQVYKEIALSQLTEEELNHEK